MFALPLPLVVLVLQPPQYGTHSHLASTTLPLHIPFLAFLKLTASSRPSAPPSDSPKSPRFGHRLTLCSVHSRQSFTYLLIYLLFQPTTPPALGAAAESSFVVCTGPSDEDEAPPPSYHQLAVLSPDGSSRAAYAGTGKALGYVTDSRGCVLLLGNDWKLHVLQLGSTVKARALQLCPSEVTRKTKTVRRRATVFAHNTIRQL